MIVQMMPTLEPDLRPNLAIVLGGSAAVALISAAALPWPIAVASTALGALMIAGADIDARTFLLPDVVTVGGLVAGLLAAMLFEPLGPWRGASSALVRPGRRHGALALVRWSYAQLTGREGVGFGDVKLAGAVGAWLPLNAIPICFALATGSALAAVLMARLRGREIAGTLKLPLGTFLCPALWFMFFATALG